MALVTKKQVIGSRLFFCREGTVIAGEGGGTVSQSYLPTIENAEPYANWDSLGGVYDFTPDPKVNTEDIVLPSPGRYRRTDEVVTSTMLDLNFTLSDISPLFFETLFLGSEPDEQGNYDIEAGTGRFRGWLKAMQADQGDNARNVFSVYVSAAFKSAKMENKLIKGEIMAKVLYSSLATGKLSFAA